MDLLKSKLIEMRYEEKLQKEREQKRSAIGNSAFGSENVVRNYTLHPDIRIKDARSNLEFKNDDILSGEGLKEMMLSVLMK